MYMGVLLASMSVQHLSAWCHGGQKRALYSLELELTDGCELLGVCWELNLVPLKDQPLLLTSE